MYVFMGIVLCFVGFRRIVLAVQFGRSLLQQGDMAGLTILQIGLTLGGGLVMLGMQLALIGLLGESASRALGWAGTIMVFSSGVLRFLERRRTR